VPSGYWFAEAALLEIPNAVPVWQVFALQNIAPVRGEAALDGQVRRSLAKTQRSL